MKGRVLGFQGTGGAINAHDGVRYSFSASAWKGQQPAQPGDEVDFVPLDGTATDIYPLVRSSNTTASAEIGDTLKRGAAAAENVVSQLRQSEATASILNFFAARPQAVLAVLILIASLILTWATLGISVIAVDQSISGVPPHPLDASVLSYPDKLDTTKIMLAGWKSSVQSQLINQKSQLVAVQQNAPNFLFGGRLDPTQQSSQMAQLTSEIQKSSDQLSEMSLLSFLMSLGYLIWLIPAGAAAILFTEYRQRRNRMLELATGAVGLAAILSFFLMQEPLTDMYTGLSLGQLDAGTMSMLGGTIGLGLGGWAIGLFSVGLLGTGLGLLRRLPGLK